MDAIPEISNYFMPFETALTEEQKTWLKGKINIINYNTKEILFKQGTRTSHIMFIIEGLVKIFKEGKNDKTHILGLSSRWEFIGLLSFFGHELHQYSAATVEKTKVAMIESSAFRTLLAENPTFGLQIIKTISKEGLFIFEKLINQTYKQLPGRMADVMLYFSEVIYKSHTFTFPLTRKELAELAGTTKESFIRTLTEFKNDKIINLDGSRVEIVNMDIIKTLHEIG